MSKLLSQIAIDLLPFSAEAMSNWEKDTDIRIFAQALYADSLTPSHGSNLCVEAEKEIRESARSFTKNLQEALLGSIYFDFYQDASFG